MKKRKDNDLLTFFAGLAMLVAGLYWFTARVSVSSGFFGGTIALGSINVNSGLIVVPFIACVVWMFVKPESFWAKVFTVMSVILIIAAVIMSTRLHFHATSLYEYLLMLVFIFGGGALVLKVINNPKYKDLDEEKPEEEPKNRYEQYFEDEQNPENKQ